MGTEGGAETDTEADTETEASSPSSSSSSSSSSSEGGLWTPGALTSGQAKPRYTGVVRRGGGSAGVKATGYAAAMKNQFSGAGAQAW